MSRNSLETRIKMLLKSEVPEIDFSQSETMADDGLLDSVSLTSILGALAGEFDLEIPYEQITPANFNSYATIADMMRNLLEINGRKI